jgi:hypothetical protein
MFEANIYLLIIDRTNVTYSLHFRCSTPILPPFATSLLRWLTEHTDVTSCGRISSSFLCIYDLHLHFNNVGLTVPSFELKSRLLNAKEQFTDNRTVLATQLLIRQRLYLNHKKKVFFFYFRDCIFTLYFSSYSQYSLYYSVIRGCIQKFPDWVDNEIHNNKHSLRSNMEGYGGKTHYTDSQNSDTTAPSCRELYHLQFSLQAASPETFGYTFVPSCPLIHGTSYYINNAFVTNKTAKIWYSEHSAPFWNQILSTRHTEYTIDEISTIAHRK